MHPIRLIRIASGCPFAVGLVIDEVEGAEYKGKGEYGGAGDIKLLSEDGASFSGPTIIDFTLTYRTTICVGEHSLH